MGLGQIVILATKTPNVGVAPPIELVIFIFVGINSSRLLPNFFNMVNDIIFKMGPPFTYTMDNFLPYIWAFTYKGFKC